MGTVQGGQPPMKESGSCLNLCVFSTEWFQMFNIEAGGQGARLASGRATRERLPAPAYQDFVASELARAPDSPAPRMPAIKPDTAEV